MDALLSRPTLRAIDLLRYRREECDALFGVLPAPRESAVDGVWRGAVMAVSGLDGLPRMLAAALYSVLAQPVQPWRGKSFAGDSGANQWGGLPGAAFGRYRVSLRDSPEDARPVLWLDYDVPENPSFLRAIRGEARALRDDVLLCRMHLLRGARTTRVLYFTLERVG